MDAVRSLKRLLAFGAAVLLTVPACGGGSADDSPSAGGDAEATVEWIHDGDTIEVTLNGSRTDIRLHGINAPDQGECYHEQATDYLIDTLKGETVTIEVVGADRFGRTLGHVYRGNADVQAGLVGRGLAIASTPDTGVGYLDEESAAIDRGAGLWSADACDGGPIPAMTIDIDPFEESVVITNTGPDTVQLGGWTLRDESSRHRFTFPGATSISSGESMVVVSIDDGWGPGVSNVWNNDGDIGMLLDSSGRVVAFQRYRAHA